MIIAGTFLAIFQIKYVYFFFCTSGTGNGIARHVNECMDIDTAIFSIVLGMLFQCQTSNNGEFERTVSYLSNIFFFMNKTITNYM